MTAGLLVLVLVLALVLVLGGRMVLQYIDGQHPEPAQIAKGAPRLGAAAAGFAAVERASLDACLCRRKGGSEAECDTIYTGARDAMLKRVYGDHTPALGGGAWACAPVATTDECFDFADGTRCLTIRYDVVAGSRDAVLTEVCTPDEARAVEQTQKQAWLGPDGKGPASGDRAALDAANRRTGAAVDALLRRIKAGERVSAPATSSGCAG